MQESSTLPERIYGLAVSDGRRTVRPLESIHLSFRLRNTATGATPKGSAIFTIPPGWTALDPVEHELPEIAPGAEFGVVVAVRAEVADDASSGAFQVALVLPHGTLGSNVVRVAVRGRPRFDGERSSLTLEPGDAPGTVRAAIALVNEGDATARDVQVCVPAPPGFHAARGVDTFAAGDVGIGAAVACSMTFIADEPPSATVHVGDARVSYAGGRDALTSGPALVLEPLLLPPAVTLERTGIRLEIALELINAGVLPARDRRARIVVPPGWRAVRGTALLGGAPVPTAREGDALVVTVPLLAARSTVHLRLTAIARAARTNGTLGVSWAGHDVTATIAPAARRSVRLSAQSSNAWMAAAPVRVEVLLWNDGETDETLTLLAGNERIAHLELRAGCCNVRHFEHPSSAAARPGDDVPLSIVVHAADGDVMATTTLQLRVAGVATVQQPATEAPPSAPQIAANWEVIPAAVPGSPFDVRLRCRFDADIIDCAIRPGIASARYVAGSTRINGHVVVDGPAGPPLFAAAGFVLHGIAAASEIAIAWSLVPDGSAEVNLKASIDADGTHLESTGPRVQIAAVTPFAQRPDGLPFHVDAALLVQPPPSAAVRSPGAPPEQPAIRFGLRLDATRRTTILRMLRGSHGGIVAHLPLFAALFPDTIDGVDPHLADALALAGESIRSIYERLFVKLRIPGYDVGPYDLEDAATRAALVALLDRAAGDATVPVPAAVDIEVTLDRATVLEARTRLAEAPLGGVDAVAAVALLLPRTGTDPAALALGSYAALIARELEAARSLAHDAFAVYLSMHAIEALERARERAISALAPVGSDVP